MYIPHNDNTASKRQRYFEILDDSMIHAVPENQTITFCQVAICYCLCLADIIFSHFDILKKYTHFAMSRDVGCINRLTTSWVTVVISIDRPK